MSEGRVQDEVRMVLSGPDIVMFRNNIATAEVRGAWVKFGVGGKGGSDLVGVVRGRAAFVEVKTPVGRLSAEQKQFAELVRSKGAEFVVLRSADEARAWLADMRQRFP